MLRNRQKYCRAKVLPIILLLCYNQKTQDVGNKETQTQYIYGCLKNERENKMHKLQAAMNNELVIADTYRLIIEVMVQGGISLSSPRMIELKKKFEEHIFSSMELKQYLLDNPCSNRKNNNYIKSV
mgnify:CR=1 FL=1